VAVTSLPSGTVAFLMSDIEGSTRLVGAAGDRFPALLDDHFALLRASVGDQRGTIVSTEGDSVFAVFPTVRAAISAAVAAQRELGAHAWPAGLELRVRIGIHVGEAVFGGRDYTGIDVHKAARIMAAAWGGEIIASQAVAALVGDALDDEVTLHDLGAHSLRDIADSERLYQVVAPGLRADFPPPRTESAAAPTNLPTPLTRFVGRRRELAELLALLETERLITLIGPGGTGKTRLAIEAARNARTTFRDGVWFVPLDIIRDATLVIPAIAQTLGVAERPGRSIADLLAEHLKSLRTLIVLDNLEQVVNVAPQIGTLVSATERVCLLCSSREQLGIAGERIYPVSPLGLPPEPGRPSASDLANSDAVELFVERARAARPGFELNDANAPAIAAICRRLDGLPLAIELAAARVNLLAPAQIMDRLDHRLGIVASTRRDLPERQRTLRGAIDWSYELLTPAECALFRRFSVFAGGADLDAVLAVVDAGDLDEDPLTLLGALVDRSLIRSVQDGAEARFEMLETIREYAAEKLTEASEEQATRDRHLAFYCTLADAAARVLGKPDTESQLDKLDQERGNLRAALAWATSSGDHRSGFRMATGLKDFWRARSHLAEARAAVDELLRVSASEGPSVELGDALAAAAELSAWHTDYARAGELSGRAVAMFEAIGDKRRLGDALAGVGWSTLLEQPEVARRSFEQSLAVRGGLEDDVWVMGTLQGLSLALYRTGEPDRARVVALQAIEMSERIGDYHTGAMNFLTLGMITLGSDDEPAAVALFSQGLERAAQVQSSIGLALSFDALAVVALRRGDLATAARLAAAAEKLRREAGGGPSVDIVGVERPIVQVKPRMSEADFSRAVSDAEAMTIQAAVALAESVVSGGGAARKSR